MGLRLQSPGSPLNIMGEISLNVQLESQKFRFKSKYKWLFIEKTDKLINFQDMLDHKLC